MTQQLTGYARCSTDDQDLTAQRNALAELGVPHDRIYVDHGLTGTNRSRPGLREALAACSRPGDVLVVTKLDRLARSARDARDIADELTTKGVKLSLGGSVYDPTDPIGKMVFSMMSVFAEFEADLISQRTKEGMKVAKAKGRLRGKQPKLSPKQEAHLVELHGGGEHTIAEIAELFGVARSTVGRAVGRAEQFGARRNGQARTKKAVATATAAVLAIVVGAGALSLEHSPADPGSTSIAAPPVDNVWPNPEQAPLKPQIQDKVERQTERQLEHMMTTKPKTSDATVIVMNTDTGTITSKFYLPTYKTDHSYTANRRITRAIS